MYSPLEDRSSQDVMAEVDSHCSMAHLRNMMRKLSANGGQMTGYTVFGGSTIGFIFLLRHM